jgi:Bacterial regulatory helix-turn-helix protein, lysR family
VDRLDELVVFTAILDAGSLAAAARQLRRSPPAVTRSLATPCSLSRRGSFTGSFAILPRP